MSSGSPSTLERRFWGFARPIPASLLVMLAKQAEDRGMQGLLAPQVYADSPPEKRVYQMGMIDTIFCGG